MIFPNFFPEGPAMAALSERSDGNMNLHGAEAANEPPRTKAEIAHNRSCFLETVAPSHAVVVSPRLEHGSCVEIVTGAMQSMTIPKCDALITNVRNVFLTVTAADCPPVYLYDPVHQAIALIHCGWRSLALDIIEKTVDKMIIKFHTRPPDLYAIIGPGIAHCHFEVGPDVYERFGYKSTAKKLNLSLPSLIDDKLIEIGVRPRNIMENQTPATCTYCETVMEKDFNEFVGPHPVPRWFSHRRQKTQPIEAQMAVFGLIP